MDIRNVLKRLDELFPGIHKSITVYFRQYRTGDIDIEWTLHVASIVGGEEFKDFSSMMKFIDALENNLKAKNYNPKIVSEAIAEAEKIISESVPA